MRTRSRVLLATLAVVILYVGTFVWCWHVVDVLLTRRDEDSPGTFYYFSLDPTWNKVGYGFYWPLHRALRLTWDNPKKHLLLYNDEDVNAIAHMLAKGRE